MRHLIIFRLLPKRKLINTEQSRIFVKELLHGSETVFADVELHRVRTLLFVVGLVVARFILGCLVSLRTCEWIKRVPFIDPAGQRSAPL